MSLVWIALWLTICIQARRNGLHNGTWLSTATSYAAAMRVCTKHHHRSRTNVRVVRHPASGLAKCRNRHWNVHHRRNPNPRPTPAYRQTPTETHHFVSEPRTARRFKSEHVRTFVVTIGFAVAAYSFYKRFAT